MKKICFVLMLMAGLHLGATAQKISHVIIIGVDGMSPDGVMHATTPVMDSLMENGAFSMHVRNMLPTSSSTNWASMIMGAGPAQHGVTSNSWQVDDHKLPPVVEDEAGIFPTIFHVLHQQNPRAKLGAIYQWKDFGRLFEKSAVDIDKTFINENKVTDEAAEVIITERPELLFVHLDMVDGAGHKFGHGSKKYYGAVAKADLLIGRLVAAVRQAGISKHTLIIISADHGGVGKSHGGESLAEAEIPIIMNGPTVHKGFEIKEPTYIFDIAATVAWVFKATPPKAWVGRPISSAFR